MIREQHVLAVITARGGSKGIVHKNIKPVGGKPLIGWTVEAALSSRLVDKVILSTDDDTIASIAQGYGCEVPFRRPANLATDEAASMDVLIHALDSVPGNYEWVVLLQPTSPLRTASDIDGALELCSAANADFCVSVSKFEKPLSWIFALDGDRLARHLGQGVATRRQDAELFYYLNGAVYVGRAKALREQRNFIGEHTRAYVMPADRSVDIDDEADLQMADTMLRQKHANFPS